MGERLTTAHDDTPADPQSQLIDALQHCEHCLRVATFSSRSAAAEIALRKAAAALANVSPQAHSPQDDTQKGLKP
jgi:hypothetical protein